MNNRFNKIPIHPNKRFTEQELDALALRAMRPYWPVIELTREELTEMYPSSTE